MPTYVVINKSTGQEVFRYNAASPVEWGGMEFSVSDHILCPDLIPNQEPPAQLIAEEWYLNVGPFYDRFGAYKIPILAAADPLVGALIKDSMVRQYIDLHGRRTELSMAIDLLISKGYAVNKSSILDVKPTSGEVYRG